MYVEFFTLVDVAMGTRVMSFRLTRVVGTRCPCSLFLVVPLGFSSLLSAKL